MSEDNKIDDGGPAFPTEVGNTNGGNNWHQTGPTTAQFHGISKRDYFAAKAMQGLLADPENATDPGEDLEDFAGRVAEATSREPKRRLAGSF